MISTRARTRQKQEIMQMQHETGGKTHISDGLLMVSEYILHCIMSS